MSLRSTVDGIGLSPAGLEPPGDVSVERAVTLSPLAWSVLEAAAQDADASYASALCHDVRLAIALGEQRLELLTPLPGLRRRLERFRASFLAGVLAAQPSPAGDEVARILLALDRVRRAGEEDPTHRFLNRITGPESTELLVAVAHDMRSPLTSVLFLVDTIRSGYSGPLTDQQRRQLLIIYSAVFGLSSLVSDLMDLVRGGDRMIDASPKTFSLGEVLCAVRDIALPLAEEKKLELSVELPRVDRRSGHPLALNRVLLNLTTNALKFTEQGGVQVVARELSRTLVEFRVSDTGRGIPESVRETLFDAFRNRHYAPTLHDLSDFIFSSAGLGLSICQKLVASMGSTLQVESDASCGTTFSFVLELPPVARVSGAI